MPPRSELCVFCAKIDFDKVLRSQKLLSTSLGTWEGTQNRDLCPFCRLLVQSIKDSPQQPRPTHTLKLFNKASWKCCVANSEYDGGLREADYSNEHDLKSRNKSFSGLYNKRLLVKWKDCVHPVEIQCIVDDQTLEEDGPEDHLFLGRAVRPEAVDLQLVNTWLELCEDYHEQSCGSEASNSSGSHLQVSDGHRRSHSQPGRSQSPLGVTNKLRFIDVERMCIVQRPSSSTYAIMSYTWGESSMKREMPKTTLLDVENEKQTGHIPLPKHLPHTIQDCIEVARSLGYKLLWNDALCIVQDDDREQKVHIRRMDAIYHNADLTIVAGAGVHANYGLPGVSRSRRQRQYVEKIHDLRLAAVMPSYNQINDTSGFFPMLHINSRGWTLQEKLLSRRVLLFTDHQIYFRCRNGSWAEDTIMETRTLSKSIRRRASPFAWVADRSAAPQSQTESGIKFVDSIFKFSDWIMKPRDSRRDLGSFPNYAAAVKAYTPRELTYPKDRLRAISGILRTLEASLGTFHEGLPTREFHRALLWEPSSGAVVHRASVVSPSWSWAGWEFEMGFCKWSMINLENINEHPPYKMELGNTRRTPKVNWDRNIQDRTRILEVVNRETRYTLTHELDEEKFPSVWDARLFRRHATLLRLNTAIVKFNIRGGKTPHSSFRYEDLDIVDEDDRCVGELVAPSSMTLPKHCYDREFLILSWSKGFRRANIHSSYVPEQMRPVTSDDCDTHHGAAAFPVRQAESEWQVANVMLIGWDHDQDIAQRIGVGKIICSAFFGQKLRCEWVFVG